MKRDQPKVTVSINGEEQFVDFVEPGYLACFAANGDTVEIVVDYDEKSMPNR